LGGALETLLRLRGVTFDWKDPEQQGADGALKQTGFIAQEVEKVFPQWVGQDSNGFKTLMIRPTPLAALEVESIRELKEQNDELRSRVAALESSGKPKMAGLDLNGIGFGVGGLALAGALVVSRRRRVDEGPSA
jgi:hypothetical protein